MLRPVRTSYGQQLVVRSNDREKAANLAAFELQINPSHAGLHYHRLDNIKDKNFWSGRTRRAQV
jgi:hypothetical protein